MSFSHVSCWCFELHKRVAPLNWGAGRQRRPRHTGNLIKSHRDSLDGWTALGVSGGMSFLYFERAIPFERMYLTRPRLTCYGAVVVAAGCPGQTHTATLLFRHLYFDWSVRNVCDTHMHIHKLISCCQCIIIIFCGFNYTYEENQTDLHDNETSSLTSCGCKVAKEVLKILSKRALTHLWNFMKARHWFAWYLSKDTAMSFELSAPSSTSTPSICHQ